MEGELRNVYVILRHGARLQISERFNDAEWESPWPREAKFYGGMSGQLSPIGHRQALNLGVVLASKYRNFLRVCSIHGYCSTRERSIMTMWGIIDGIRGCVPECHDKHVKFDYVSSNHCPQDDNTTSYSTCEPVNDMDYTQAEVSEPVVKNTKLTQRTRDQILVHIANRCNDALFHNGKPQKEYIHLYNSLLHNCDYVKYIVNHRVYYKLWSSLYSMTNHIDLKPFVELVDMDYTEYSNLQSKEFKHLINLVVKALQTTASLGSTISVYQAHHIDIFPGLPCNQDDIKDIIDIRLQMMSMRYYVSLQGGVYPNDIRDLAEYNTTMLCSEITDSIRCDDVQSKPKFTFFSAHDITMMSVASILGIHLDIFPDYCSHMIIEHYNIQNKSYVKFGYYNRDGEGSYANWDKCDTYHAISTRSPLDKLFTLDEWTNISSTPQYIAMRNWLLFDQPYTYKNLDIKYLSYVDSNKDGYISYRDIEEFCGYFHRDILVSDVYKKVLKASVIKIDYDESLLCDKDKGIPCEDLRMFILSTTKL